MRKQFFERLIASLRSLRDARRVYSLPERFTLLLLPPER